MGWEMPWYSAQKSLDTLLVGRRVGMMHIVCYLRQGSNVFETYWTTRRGVEAMDNSYALLDMTVYGRQETWEDSPTGWPQRFKGKQATRTDGRPHRPMVPPRSRTVRQPQRHPPLEASVPKLGRACWLLAQPPCRVMRVHALPLLNQVQPTRADSPAQRRPQHRFR
jgi:hypothetical protein